MRLIDAEHLIKRATNIMGDCWDNYAQGTGDFIEYIGNEPTVDAEPVRHGHWTPCEFGNYRWHKCSVCGKADEYINERGLEAIRNYCPNCGARMDEKT